MDASVSPTVLSGSANLSRGSECFLSSTDSLIRIGTNHGFNNNDLINHETSTDHHLILFNEDMSFYNHNLLSPSLSASHHQIQSPYDDSESTSFTSSDRHQQNATTIETTIGLESPMPQSSSDDENRTVNSRNGQLLQHQNTDRGSDANVNLAFRNESLSRTLSQDASSYSLRSHRGKRAASTSLTDSQDKPRIKHRPDPCNSPSSGVIALGTLATASPRLSGYGQHLEVEGNDQAMQQPMTKIHRQNALTVLAQHLDSNIASNVQQLIRGNSVKHQMSTSSLGTSINNSDNDGNQKGDTATSTPSRSRLFANINSKRCGKIKQINRQGIVSPSDFESKSDIVAYVEQKLEDMEESFTFKSATYQTHLKRFLPRPDDKHRKYIERIETFPRIPTSAAEQRELINLRKVRRGMAPDSRLGEGNGLTIKERLDEMLTSLVNKIMFLLVVKFDTWYIHAPAREQIREALLEFIWPDLPEMHSFFREHFTLFIDMRIRHFRDSVARYFRDRPKTDVKSGDTANGTQQSKQFKDTPLYNRSTTHHGSSGVLPLLSVSSIQNSNNGYSVNPVYDFVKALSNPTNTRGSSSTKSNQYLKSLTNYSIPQTQHYSRDDQYTANTTETSSSSIASITSPNIASPNIASPNIASPLSESLDNISDSPLHCKRTFTHSLDFAMIDPHQRFDEMTNRVITSRFSLRDDFLGNSNISSNQSGTIQNDFLDFGSGSLINNELLGYTPRSLSMGELSTSPLSSAGDISSYCHMGPSHFGTANPSLISNHKGFIESNFDLSSYFECPTSRTTEKSFLQSSNFNLNDESTAVLISLGPSFEQPSINGSAFRSSEILCSSSAPELAHNQMIQSLNVASNQRLVEKYRRSPFSSNIDIIDNKSETLNEDDQICKTSQINFPKNHHNTIQYYQQSSTCSMPTVNTTMMDEFSHDLLHLSNDQISTPVFEGSSSLVQYHIPSLQSSLFTNIAHSADNVKISDSPRVPTISTHGKNCRCLTTNSQQKSLSLLLRSIPHIMPMTIQAAANSSSSSTPHIYPSMFQPKITSFPYSRICPTKTHRYRSASDDNTTTVISSCINTSSSQSVQNRLPPRMPLHIDPYVHHRKGVSNRSISVASPVNPMEHQLVMYQHQDNGNRKDTNLANFAHSIND